MTKDLFPNFVNVSPQTHQREQWRDKGTVRIVGDLTN